MSTFLVLILSRFRSLSGQGFLPQASKSPSGIISTLSHCYTVFVLSEITASSNLSEAHDSFSARRCGIYRILVFRCENLQTLQRNAKVSFKILRGLRSSIRKKARQEEICLVVYLNLRSLLKKPCSSGKRDQQARKNYKCSFIFGACHLHQENDVDLLSFLMAGSIGKDGLGVRKLLPYDSMVSLLIKASISATRFKVSITSTLSQCYTVFVLHEIAALLNLSEASLIISGSEVYKCFSNECEQCSSALISSTKQHRCCQLMLQIKQQPWRKHMIVIVLVGVGSTESSCSEVRIC